jgi:hypothetical protein
MAIPIKAALVLSTKAFNVALKASTKAVGVFAGVAKSAAIAVTAVAGVLTAVVYRQTQLIDSLGKTSSKLGIGVEFLQKFRFAAEQTGVGTDTADMALQRFTRRLGEAQKGTGELLPALRDLGFTQNQIAKLSPEEALFALADALEQVESPTERLALAFKAFDSEGAALINTIGGGKDELLEFFGIAEDLGFILSGDAVRGVEKFNDTLNELFLIIGGVINGVVAALAPTLVILTEQMKDFFKEVQDADGTFNTLAREIKDSLIVAFDSFLGGLERVVNFMADLGNAIVKLGRAVPGLDLFPVDDDSAERYKEITDAVDILQSAQSNLDDSLFSSFREGITPGDVTSTALDELDKLGVMTDKIREKIADLGILDTVGRTFGFTTDDAAEIIEMMKNAISVGLSLSEDELATFFPFGTADFSGLRETIRNEIGKGFTAGIKDAGDDPDTVEPILTMFEKLANKFAEIMETSTATIGKRLKDAGVGQFTKTLEDGLIKAATMFEDTLAEAFVNGKADFSDLADFIKVTLAKAFIQKSITGPLLALFGLPGFDGGGYTGNGARVGGVDGKGGFPAILHPNETVVDHAMGQGGTMGGTTIINNISAIDTLDFQSRIAQDPTFIYAVTQAGARNIPGSR